MKNNVTLYSILAAMLVAAPAVSAAQAPRSAAFEARHELKIVVPEGARQLRIWLALPQQDPLQQVDKFKVNSPVPHRVTTDSEGNTAVYLEVNEPKLKEFTVVETFTLQRREQVSGVDAKKARPLRASERNELAPFLAANQHVIIDDRIRELAAKIVSDQKNFVLASRKLAGQSYQCWPEFYAAGLGWVPHDAAIDERRVTWSRGRDLTLSPRQNGGPVSALAKAYLEVDGKAAAEKEVWTRKLTFREIKP